MLEQAWRSDALKEDWELERSVDDGKGGSRMVRLRGAGGVVDSLVTSVLADVTQALPPCSHTECCELSDDAALEVCSPLCVCARACVCRVVNDDPCGRRGARLARPCSCCSCCTMTGTRTRKLLR